MSKPIGKKIENMLPEYDRRVIGREHLRHDEYVAGQIAAVWAKYGPKDDKPRRDQIDELVAEYNKVEAEQGERLKRLFLLVLKGEGYKKLMPFFDVNAFRVEDRLDYRIEAIGKLCVFISDVDPGVDQVTD